MTAKTHEHDAHTPLSKLQIGMFTLRLNFLPRITFLIVFSIIMSVPFWWMLSTSLKAEYQVLLFPPRWFPIPIKWQNYPDVFIKAPFVVWFGNTLFITVVSLVGTLFSASLVAYGFARIQFWGRNVLFILVLSTMMLPDVVTLIPTFILFSRLDWIDTFLPLIVPVFFGGSAFFIFLIRQYFTTIPFDLEEAAFIDGASTFTVFWRIILPLAKPVLGTVGLFSFLGNWNDFMRPMIYLNSPEKKTLAVGLRYFQSQWGTEWALMMAAATIMIVPVLIVFFFTQRFFVKGIALSGLGGR